MVLQGVESTAHAAFNVRCSLCHRYGASLSCRVSDCDCNFHFLCAAGAGCLLVIESLDLLCPKHIFEAANCK